MKKINYAAQAVLALALVSCAGSSSTKQDVLADSSSINVNTVPTIAPSTVTPSTVPVNQTGTQTISSAPIVLPQQIQPINSNTAAAGLNPAHGQPGHRCELAVGAPLNSSPTPVKANTSQATTVSTPVTYIQSQSKTVTPAGMNPPHGEPGHRCDITVGQPLNSKPAPTTTITPVVTPSTDTTKN